MCLRRKNLVSHDILTRHFPASTAQTRFCPASFGLESNGSDPTPYTLSHRLPSTIPLVPLSLCIRLPSSPIPRVPTTITRQTPIKRRI